MNCAHPARCGNERSKPTWLKQASEIDLKAASLARALTKVFFDLLRNVMLLGVLKYFAIKTGSTFLLWVYYAGIVMLFFAAYASWDAITPIKPFTARVGGRLGYWAALHIAATSLVFGLAIAGLITAVDAISKAQPT